MQRIDAIASLLDKEAPDPIRFLTETDPFRFLVCVVLSAQTTDEAVNRVAPVLWRSYPTRHDLAVADAEAVESIIRPLGFFHTKARHIIALAAALDGKPIPSEMEDLVKLPGVGRKTANCYRGDILHAPAIIVDTHFARVVRRLGLVDSRDPAVIEREIAAGLAPERRYRFSMTANWWGRQVCHARRPDCARCRLSGLCPSKA